MTTPSWSTTAGSPMWSRGRRSRRTPRAPREVHDLGDVSLLSGFVETHVQMHFPAPLDYREIAQPEPVERMIIRATAAMRRLLLSGAPRPATRAVARTSRLPSAPRCAMA